VCGLWVEGVGVEGLGWEMWGAVDGRIGGCVGSIRKKIIILLINIFLYFIPSQVSNPPKTPLTENSIIPSIPVFLYPSPFSSSFPLHGNPVKSVHLATRKRERGAGGGF